MGIMPLERSPDEFTRRTVIMPSWVKVSWSFMFLTLRRIGRFTNSLKIS